MKKDRSYVIIRISFIMIMINFVTFYGTHAFFTDSEELLTNINITTGTLDIQLKDTISNTVGNQRFILDLNQTTKSQMIGSLTVKDMGSLSSNLSARVILKGLPDTIKFINVSLVDSSGGEMPLNANYIMINNIHNSGLPFKVKISYTGTLPLNYSGLSINVELRAIQPNDDLTDARMFTDVQEIQFNMPQEIKLAFSDGIPIEGTVMINHKNDTVIKLLPL